VSTSNAAIKAERLGVHPAISHKPTLGRRIHFAYCTRGLWLSELDAERLRRARLVHQLSGLWNTRCVGLLGKSAARLAPPR
jgi:hypothetical protein